jgi:hypothetical protein
MQRWDDSKMDLKGVGWEGVDWITGYRPVTDSCGKYNEPSHSI